MGQTHINRVSFKGIAEKLRNAKVSPDFWKKEAENIAEFDKKAREERESLKMTHEKFTQEFTI